MKPYMQCRIMTVKVKLELIEEAIRAWPQYVPNFAGRGLIAQFTGVDRKTGDVRSVTIWESHDTMKANENRTDIVDSLKGFERFYANTPAWSYFDLTSSFLDISRLSSLAERNDKGEVWYHSYK